VEKEFGFEGQHTSSSVSAPPEHVSASTASASTSAGREQFRVETPESAPQTAANIRAAQREFGPER
jgi:hypothetical protein